MRTMATNVSAPSSTPQARRYRHLEAELKFCRSALLRGNQLAAQGQLETATRELWLAEDTVEAMDSVVARIEDPDKLRSYQREVAQVQKELGDLRTYLCIPPLGYTPVTH